MRKVTQRIAGVNDIFRFKQFHLFWIILLLMFLQQIGKAQSPPGCESSFYLRAGATVDTTCADGNGIFFIEGLDGDRILYHIDSANTNIFATDITLSISDTNNTLIPVVNDTLCSEVIAADSLGGTCLGSLAVSDTLVRAYINFAFNQHAATYTLVIDSVFHGTDTCVLKMDTDTVVALEYPTLSDMISSVPNNVSACEDDSITFNIEGTENSILDYSIIRIDGSMSDTTYLQDTLINRNLQITFAVDQGTDTLKFIIDTLTLGQCTNILSLTRGTVVYTFDIAPQIEVDAGDNDTICLYELPMVFDSAKVLSDDTSAMARWIPIGSNSHLIVPETNGYTKEPDTVKFTVSEADTFLIELISNVDTLGTSCETKRDTVQLVVLDTAVVDAGNDTLLFVGDFGSMSYAFNGASVGGATNMGAWSLLEWPNTADLNQLSLTQTAATSNPESISFDINLSGQNSVDYIGDYTFVLTSAANACRMVTDTVVVRVDSKKIMSLNDSTVVHCNNFNGESSFTIDFEVIGGSGGYVIVNTHNNANDTLATLYNGIKNSPSVRHAISLPSSSQDQMLSLVIKDTLVSQLMSYAVDVLVPSCSADSVAIDNAVVDSEVSVQQRADIHDPCTCNDDQSANGAQDGTFDETIIVKDLRGTATWTVVEFRDLENNTSTVSGATINFDTLQKINDSIYQINITHTDDFGYFIRVSDGTMELVDSNRCAYPEIEIMGVSDGMVIDQNSTTKINVFVDEITDSTIISYDIIGDTTMSLSGPVMIDDLECIEPNTLPTGEYTLRATFRADSVSNDIDRITDNTAQPGCETEELLRFSVVDSIILSTSFCNCTGATGVNELDFADTIVFGTSADSMIFSSVMFFEPDTRTIVASAFFEENSIIGERWNPGDTLAQMGMDTFVFAAFFRGNKDAIVTFITTDDDTVQVFIPACTSLENVDLMGPDTICMNESLTFELSERVDSVTWTFGNKYGVTLMDSASWTIADVDTSGLITVTASGIHTGSAACVPFEVTKTVYVQENDFEIIGNSYVCLNDTVAYHLDLKGAMADFSTTTGLVWTISSNGRTIGDSINTTTLQVMWDDMNGAHTISVQGQTTNGCPIDETFMVTVDSILHAQVEGEDEICLGGTTAYKAQTANIDTLLWSILPADAGTVTEISEDSVSVQWHRSGTHKIYVRGSVSDFSCVVEDSTIEVTVLDTSFNLVGFGAACQSDTTGFSIRHLDNSLIDLQNIQWSVVRVADNANLTILDTLSLPGSTQMDSIIMNWDSLGNHIVTVTGTTAAGCEISESMMVSVRGMDFSIAGDQTVCLNDTTVYMLHDANGMSVSNMRTIEWSLFDDSGNPTGMVLSDDTIRIIWDIPGQFELRVAGATEDGCAVEDTIQITAVNTATINIEGGPRFFCSEADAATMQFTLSVADSLLSNISWRFSGISGRVTSFEGSNEDTFNVFGYSLLNLDYDSMSLIVSANVGSGCTVTDTVPVIVRSGNFDIEGDNVICNISDSTFYWVDVPGIDSISWEVTGTGNEITTLGSLNDTVSVKWATNGKIQTFIRATDGCILRDTLQVFVRENSVLYATSAGCGTDTVTYTIKGIAGTDTLDFSDLVSIDWHIPAAADSITINDRGDSLTVKFNITDTGQPFYLDTIGVTFVTNDGCQDTISRALILRETDLVLIGMDELCQDLSTVYRIGFKDELGESKFFDDSLAMLLTNMTWSLPDGGTVTGVANDSAVLEFPDAGVYTIVVSGTWDDGCPFELTDSVTIRSNQLAILGDVDGVICANQTNQTFSIEEITGGRSTILGDDQFDAIVWAISDTNQIVNGINVTNNTSFRDSVTATAISANPVSASTADLRAHLLNEIGNSFNFTNASLRGMTSSINTNITAANSQLAVSLVTTSGCTYTQPISLNTQTGDNVAVACDNLINVSLDHSCTFLLTPEMILEEPADDLTKYSLRLTDEETGQFISNGRVGPNEVGKTLILTAIHDCSGNSCWGRVFVEDKNIPDLICAKDTINCEMSTDPSETHWTFDKPRYRGFPIPPEARATPIAGRENAYHVTNFEQCGVATLTYTDTEDALSCADGLSRQIYRTWKVSNGSNLENICTDTILVTKVSVSVFDYTRYIGNKEYTCEQKDLILTANGYPNAQLTGNLESIKGAPCYQFNAGFTDTKAELCGGTVKFFRHWTVIDWCTSEDTSFLQIITFEDGSGPQINAPIVYDNISDDHKCNNTFAIAKPTYFDCSGLIRVRLELRELNGAWTVWDERTTNFDQPFENISFGNEGDIVQARFIVTDECGNVSTSVPSTNITIMDNISPTAVCDEEVVVTLNSDGEAFATYKSFDDGSSDNCGIVNYEIRRLSNNCNDTESTKFGKIVKFCCADIANSDVRVELRVTDAAGNFNTCVSTVTVQEIITSIKAENVPPDVTVSCDQDLSNLDALWPDPQFFASVCGVKIDPEETVIRNIDNCGKGRITRTWTARNENLNSNMPIELGTGTTVTSIQQVITVGKDDEILTNSNISWPQDVEGDGCLDNLDPDTNTMLGKPTFNNVPCSKAISTYSDLIFKDTEGYCVKVVRKWSVIDWCTTDEIDRTNQNSIFFEHIQVIKLKNSVAPQFTSGCENQSLSTTSSGGCSGFYTFTATASDDCDNESLKWKYEVDTDNNGTIDATGNTNVFDMSLNMGSHTIKWTVTDACGNSTTCEKLVNVSDINAPNIKCVAEHEVFLNTDGEAILLVESLNQGTTDDCSPSGGITYSFVSHAVQTTINFNCNSKDSLYTVYATDQSGNTSSCQVFIDVTDAHNVCTNSGAVAITGTIATEEKYTVDNVDVVLRRTSGETVMNEITPINGTYAFNDVNSSNQYILEPSKNDDYDNGVTTLDIVLMQRHVLGLKTIESPYKIIAADVTGDDFISVQDMVSIRKLLLGLTDKFPINKSWRFVDADYEFADKYFPFPFDEVYDLRNVDENMQDLDFVAVKLGDINGNVSLASAQLSDPRSVATFEYSGIQFNQDELISIPLSVTDNTDLSGLQLEIKYDSKMMKFSHLSSEYLNINADQVNVTNDGRILLSWNTAGNVPLSEGQDIVYMHFTALTNGSTDYGIELTKDYLHSEYYTVNDSGIKTSRITLALDSDSAIKEQVSITELYNSPNPFNEMTDISFELSNDALLKLEIYNVNGMKVYSASGQYRKGKNTIRIDQSILSQPGIFLYQLSDDHTVMRNKMILIK